MDNEIRLLPSFYGLSDCLRQLKQSHVCHVQTDLKGVFLVSIEAGGGARVRHVKKDEEVNGWVTSCQTTNMKYC